VTLQYENVNIIPEFAVVLQALEVWYSWGQPCCHRRQNATYFKTTFRDM